MKKVIYILIGIAIIIITISLAMYFFLVRSSRQTLESGGQKFSFEFSRDSTDVSDPDTNRKFLTSKELGMGIGIAASSSQKDCAQNGSKSYQQVTIAGNPFSLCAATDKQSGQPAIWTVTFQVNSKWYTATLIPNSAQSIPSQQQAAKIFSSIQVEQ